MGEVELVFPLVPNLQLHLICKALKSFTRLVDHFMLNWHFLTLKTGYHFD